MTYVDSAVLDFTELLCRRFQIWTGRTNVWLAFQLTNLSIVVYFVWAIGLYWISGDAILRAFVAMFCGGVFFVLTRTIFRTSVDASEAAAYQRVAKGVRNPRRLRDAQLRITFLTLSIVLTLSLSFVLWDRRWLALVRFSPPFIVLTEALTVLTTIVLYVLACDPLPPCAGKVRDWVRRGAAQPIYDNALGNCAPVVLQSPPSAFIRRTVAVMRRASRFTPARSFESANPCAVITSR